MTTKEKLKVQEIHESLMYEFKRLRLAAQNTVDEFDSIDSTVKSRRAAIVALRLALARRAA